MYGPSRSIVGLLLFDGLEVGDRDGRLDGRDVLRSRHLRCSKSSLEFRIDRISDWFFSREVKSGVVEDVWVHRLPWGL